MAQIVHRYPFPDRFVAGTIGRPGERTFFLQARRGSRLTSVLVEKQQVQILADHVERVLDELSRQVAGLSIPEARSVAKDLDPLDLPLTEEFRVGSMGIAWDADDQAIQIDLIAMTESDEEDESDPDEEAEFVEVRITPDQAREFVARSRSLVAAGRPACPFCAQPINPEGHICPRANGYRRPLFE